MVLDAKGMAELLQQWQKAATDAAQSWASLYGQKPQADPLAAYRQMSETWLKAFSSAFKQQAPPTSPEALRQFMDESLEMWTKTLADVMGGQEYGAQMGQVLAQNLAMQGSLRRAMEPYMEETLRTLSLPSRKQVLGLAEQLKAIEQRLETLEDRLDEIHDAVKSSAQPGAHGGPATPRRSTRRAATE